MKMEESRTIFEAMVSVYEKVWEYPCVKSSEEGTGMCSCIFHKGALEKGRSFKVSSFQRDGVWLVDVELIKGGVRICANTFDGRIGIITVYTNNVDINAVDERAWQKCLLYVEGEFLSEA